MQRSCQRHEESCEGAVATEVEVVVDAMEIMVFELIASGSVDRYSFTSVWRSGRMESTV